MHPTAASLMSVLSSGNVGIGTMGLDQKLYLGWDLTPGNSRVNKKGQDEIHLALALLGSLFPNEDKINLTCKYYLVKDGILSFSHRPRQNPIQSPQAGFEPASASSLGRRFIQLSYRGHLIFDKESIIIDNLSNSNCSVKKNNPFQGAIFFQEVNGQW